MRRKITYITDFRREGGESKRHRIICIALILLFYLSLFQYLLYWNLKPEAAAAPDVNPELIADRMVAVTLAEERAPEPETAEENTAAYPLTADERDLTAAVCFFEARGEGPDGMAAVAEVVYNRLKDGRFGDTISEVCTPDQFHGLKQLGTMEVTQEAYEAVDAVFRNGQADTTGGALFFCTEATDPDDIKPGLVETAVIGNHIFYTD